MNFFANLNFSHEGGGDFLILFTSAKTRSKIKVRIEWSIKEKSCSAISIHPKTVVEPYLDENHQQDKYKDENNQCDISIITSWG